MIEVKEKKQPLSARWAALWPSCPAEDLFVIDELSVRRALEHWPAVYFVLRDRPTDRIFVASLTEIVAAERVRVNRAGKGKWIVCLLNFPQIPALDRLFDHCMSDMLATPWKRSDCLSALEVPQV